MVAWYIMPAVLSAFFIVPLMFQWRSLGQEDYGSIIQAICLVAVICLCLGFWSVAALIRVFA